MSHFSKMEQFYGHISTTYFKHNGVMKVTWNDIGLMTNKNIFHIRKYEAFHPSPKFQHPSHQYLRFYLALGDLHDGRPCLYFSHEFDCLPTIWISFEGNSWTQKMTVTEKILLHDKMDDGAYEPKTILFKILSDGVERFEVHDFKSPKWSRYNFCTLRQNEDLMDMSFKADDGIEFKAHKLIVSYASPVLKARLQTQIGDKDDPILVPFKSEIFGIYLEFIYGQSRKFYEHLELSKLMDLFMVSNFYGTDDLSAYCQRMIVIYLTGENLMQVLCHDIVALVDAYHVVKACVTLLQESKVEDIKDWNPKVPRVTEFILKHFKPHLNTKFVLTKN